LVVIIVEKSISFIWDISVLTILHRHVDLLSILGLLHVQWWVSIVEPCGVRAWETLHGPHSLVLGVKNLWDVGLELFFLGLHILDGEWDDSSAHLYSHSMMSLESQLILEQNDGAELGGIVFNVETILLAFNDGVTSTYTDIVDTHLWFMTSTKFELSLFRSNGKQMDISRSILVERHWLQQDIVSRGLSGNLVCLINNLVNSRSNFESVWIHLFANLALESLPVEWPHILVLSTWWFLLLLSKNPGLEALEMDETHWSLTLAGDNERIGLIILVTPTNSALNLILTSIIKVLGTLDLHSFSQLLLIQLILRHVNIVASEVLDSESNTTQLDCVKFFNFVVIFAALVLQRTSY
jgi:hypothetical protein